MKKTSALSVIFSIIFFLVNESQAMSSTENKLPIKMRTDKLIFIGFGSPIVDGIMNYESNPKLAEELKMNMKYHLTKESPLELYYSAFDSEHTEILLGGSALNTVRVINYLLNSVIGENLKANAYQEGFNTAFGEDFELGYIGAIGKDKYGKFVKTKLAEEGIVLLGSEVEDKITSTAIVLIESRERNIFAHISASKKIKAQDLKNYIDLISTSKIFYADSYLINLSFGSFEYVFTNFSNSEVLLALSLSNDSLIEDNFEKYVQIFPFADIIIGNNEEYKVIKKLLGLSNIETNEFFEIFSEKFEKSIQNKKRIMINTRGKNSTIIYVKDYNENIQELIEVPAIPIDEREIIDLNGAGDGFAGGFFTGLLLNLNLYQSGLLGNKIASEIIKLKGFQLPHGISYEDLTKSLNLDFNLKSSKSPTQKLEL